MLFRHRFNELIDRAMPYEDNLNILLDEARKIATEEQLRKRDFKVERSLTRLMLSFKR